jgi:hypothetical protein
VRNYVEPFAGSLAVLLARPHEPKVETVNDKDAFLANFWRAVQADPDAVADYADWPVNEADLHARHRWLVERAATLREAVMADPEYCDDRIAGWWVWGQCLWIGSGWGKPVGARHANGTRKAVDWNQRPDLSAPNGRGEVIKLSKQVPHLGNDGRGVAAPAMKRPALTGNGHGVGVHRVSLSRQVRDLSGDSGAVGRGIHASGFDDRTGGIHDYMRALQQRLRRVRVCCGEWDRITGPAVTTCIGMTGVFLDPPYGHGERVAGLYAEDHDVAPAVREWALANADNPDLRIALCGYEGEHAMPDEWECVEWKASGGYGARTERGRENSARERIWFSPACIKPERQQRGLFDVA